MKERTNVKLNLGLRVLGRRPDGFHDLETLFVPFAGLGDDIEIVPSVPGGSWSLPENYGPSALSLPTGGWAPPVHDIRGPRKSADFWGDSVTGGYGFPVETSSRREKVRLVAEPAIDWAAEQDLCVRAYRALDADWDLPPVEIRLRKEAPTGAGLGGGSADAAWTLRMLRDMFSLPLTDADLARYAAALGSDCPFFVYNRPMIGRGRGEILEPFELDLSAYDIRVEVPEGVSVNTGAAYRAIDEAGAGTSDGRPSLSEILSLPPEQWRGSLANDFEGPVFAAWPQIAALKERMYADGAVYAAMSGSGSAVFGLFKK